MRVKRLYLEGIRQPWLAGDPQETWRRYARWAWKNILKEAEGKGDVGRAKYARKILRMLCR